MLVSLQKIISMAEQEKFCVPAFNVYNIETVMGIIAAAEENKAPVILQVYPRLLNEEVGYYLSPAVLAAAQKASVPVCYHLDHGASQWEVTRALRWGCTGVMLDGSAHSFEENVRLTKDTVEICKSIGICVEGELGHVGSVNDNAMGDFTDPTEAALFAEQTGICALAVLVGNAHGHYKKTPALDIDRIRAIRKATNLPLVLHGGSGIPEDQVKAAINAGIRKMNIGTDVCCAFADGTLAALQNPARSLAVDVFMKGAIETVKQLAMEKICLAGAEGKANG